MRSKIRRRRRAKKGLITLSIIGILLFSSKFAPQISQALSNSFEEDTIESMVDTIDVFSNGTVVVDIDDEDIKGKIEEAINDAINEIQWDLVREGVSDPIIDINKHNARMEEEEILIEEKRQEIAMKIEEEERAIKEEEERLMRDKEIRVAKEKKRIEERKDMIVASRGKDYGKPGRDLGTFSVTSYDLSVDSCGKPMGHKGYGITASGYSLVGHTWDSARAIAVDPRVIPMGSKVRVTFTNDSYKKYDGVYTAVDTGGAIKGNIIDFFMGDFSQNKAHDSVWAFGRTKANVEILE